MVDRFNRFSYGIFEISRCWHKLASDVMREYDLKGPYALYLVTILRSQEPLTAVRLTEVCARDKADVSRALATMERKGLIRREGVQYRAVLVLTEQGRAAAEEVSRRACMAVELAGKGFSKKERDVFYKVMEIITENMKSLSTEGLPTKEE